MMEDRHPLLPHLMALLESARRDVVISCPEAVMPLFDSDIAISEILRVARRAPQTGLRVLLRQFDPVQFGGSRFVRSIQRIPTKAECRLLEQHSEWRSETLVVIDEAVGLMIPTQTRRPPIHLSDRRQVTVRLNRFNVLWNAAYPAHDMRRLH